MGIKCCLGCADRHVGCHSSCGRYAEERAVLDMENKARFQHDVVDCTHHNAMVNHLMPNTRERKRHRHKV